MKTNFVKLDPHKCMCEDSIQEFRIYRVEYQETSGCPGKGERWVRASVTRQVGIENTWMRGDGVNKSEFCLHVIYGQLQMNLSNSFDDLSFHCETVMNEYEEKGNNSN